MVCHQQQQQLPTGLSFHFWRGSGNDNAGALVAPDGSLSLLPGESLLKSGLKDSCKASGQFCRRQHWAVNPSEVAERKDVWAGHPEN